MKTNQGLVEYCKAQLGLPYRWGTFGQVATASLYNQKKAQYPNQYTATDFPKQYGKKVHDCVGLIKGYLWTNENGSIRYNSAQDKDVNGMLNNCTEKGHISSMPDIPGILVFLAGHVGVYVGNGEVIEARGHFYGVVRTKLNERSWTKWGKLDWIEYKEYTEAEDMIAYQTLEEVPEWGKKTVKKLVDNGYLTGTDKGLNLSQDMLRVFVIHDRMGMYKMLDK